MYYGFTSDEPSHRDMLNFVRVVYLVAQTVGVVESSDQHSLFCRSIGQSLFSIHTSDGLRGSIRTVVAGMA